MTHVCCLSAVLATMGLAAPVPTVDYQAKADAATWEWRDKRVTLLDHVLSAPREYEIAIIRPKDTFSDLTIRFTLDDKSSYSWIGHDETPFLVLDKILYHADYSPSSDGCTVVAYDLANKKQLWKTSLKGLGPINHFRYHNAVQIDIDGDALRVFGKESAGGYVEYVALNEGKTVGHKVFK